LARSGGVFLGEQHSVRGVGVRTYGTGDRAATLIWLHGGGWVYGEPEGDDEILAHLAARCDVDVVAVRYRLAPEHPFPAALDDALAVYQHIAKSGRPIVIAGASAGATLAAGLCLLLRDRGDNQPAAQLLICPPLDDQARDDDDGPLRRADMDRYWRMYLGAAEPNSYAAPARAHTTAGLAPAHIYTTSADPLRLEGWRYAGRLAADGVEVNARFLPGGFHGFEYEAPRSAFSRRFLSEIASTVRNVTRSPRASRHATGTVPA
ncbi:alpha/beta hydrolase, partial [Microbacterium sp.]|uniref:alpha/beta hydrolase n=1 Tax=Microbacterium sp. TaxID=51671 RepID=UPI0035B018E3